MRIKGEDAHLAPGSEETLPSLLVSQVTGAWQMVCPAPGWGSFISRAADTWRLRAPLPRSGWASVLSEGEEAHDSRLRTVMGWTAWEDKAIHYGYTAYVESKISPGAAFITIWALSIGHLL